MGRIDGDPSADDDQAITDTKNDLGHGLLADGCSNCTRPEGDRLAENTLENGADFSRWAQSVPLPVPAPYRNAGAGRSMPSMATR